MTRVLVFAAAVAVLAGFGLTGIALAATCGPNCQHE